MSAILINIIQNLYYFCSALLQQFITQIEGRSYGLDHCGHIFLIRKLIYIKIIIHSQEPLSFQKTMKAVEVSSKGIILRRKYIKIEALRLVVHSLISRTITHKIRVTADGVENNCLGALLVINIQIVCLKFLNSLSEIL